MNLYLRSRKVKIGYFSDEIKAGNLVSSSGSPPVGEIVTLTGWGRPSDSASGISDVLRQVDVPIMSNADCDAVYGIINEGIICVDAANGMGSCNVSRLHQGSFS